MYDFKAFTPMPLTISSSINPSECITMQDGLLYDQVVNTTCKGVTISTTTYNTLKSAQRACTASAQCHGVYDPDCDGGAVDGMLLCGPVANWTTGHQNVAHCTHKKSAVPNMVKAFSGSAPTVAPKLLYKWTLRADGNGTNLIPFINGAVDNQPMLKVPGA